MAESSAAANAPLAMTLACPSPVTDSGHVVMGHGSGGLLSQQLLERSVFQRFRSAELDERHDGAVLSFAGPVAFSTDSYVVSPIEFPGGTIGELAVHGTINDLAMCGATAEVLSLGLILEEGLPLATLDRVLGAAADACAAAGVRVVTGDTKVVERGKGDGLYINTSGIGTVHPRAAIRASRMRAGDVLLVNAPIATHGVAIMSVREGLQFETTVTSDTRPLHRIVRALLDACGEAVHCLRDATRGGLGSVLAELAQQGGVGMRVRQAALPILEEVDGACELLGLDPLYVANEGVFVAIVDGAHAEAALAAMRGAAGGETAVAIGEVTADNAGLVLLESAIGGTRIVHLPPGEQLPRIC
ncbi:MAG: hydrogenase expression/formation protein HypE [Gemmatimonadaceae bacterium]|nr:hydrogenase expression/formation protein HypE [Gemmatimonadaceae bacterium]